MKRRDMVRELLRPGVGDAPAPEPAARVASGAVRAMGLQLDRLSGEAREAEALRRQIAAGASIVDLDPAVVEPSFVSDRLSRTADNAYRRLVESIEQSGQLLPILVRPNPGKPGAFQIAYGHRRREAAAELGIPVKAIVRELTDDELVVAQGKENAERTALSFIERACFAAELERRGFSRATLHAALGVHKAEMSRLLGVASAVPASVARAIGPAPKAGRPRWMELAQLVGQPDFAGRLERLLQQASFQRLSSDRRFETALAALRTPSAESEGDCIRDARGEPVIRVQRAGTVLRFVVDGRLAPGLGPYLAATLPELVARFEASTGPEPTEGSADGGCGLQ